MTEGIEIVTAEFVVESRPGASKLKLTWPSDRYYGLIRNPVQLVHMNASDLANLARNDAPRFPDVRRLAFLMHWFGAAASRNRMDWPALPVLSRKGGRLVFVDGRHRCEALLILEATRIPVIVG